MQLIAKVEFQIVCSYYILIEFSWNYVSSLKLMFIDPIAYGISPISQLWRGGTFWLPTDVYWSHCLRHFTYFSTMEWGVGGLSGFHLKE